MDRAKRGPYVFKAFPIPYPHWLLMIEQPTGVFHPNAPRLLTWEPTP